MARRGYFERQSGDYRLRMVEEGYDADDEATPANNVIIDTNSLGTLSVFRRGKYVATSNGQLNGGVVASGWGLSYVPLCMFWYTFPSSGELRNFNLTLTGTTSPVNRMIVTNDGITVYLPNNTASSAFPFIINWVAFRLPVIQL